MIRKLLVANRGEIACRIIKTCRDMGIATVAVYSDADARALHVELADEAVHIGASAAADSYLSIPKIIAAAERTGANAVHPGYGFLAENAAFAQAVIDAGLIWVGPTPAAIEAMGDKRRAKLLLKDIPLVPGYSGADQSDAALIAAAGEIGCPIMVKAAAGGGGKGMRRVDSLEEMSEALAGARREALAAFGDDTLILEKYIERARHIEIQIFGDTYGNVIALGERECSIQRRHQKIIEETPSTALDDDLRQRMCEAAVSVGRQIGYVNAGTVEFILDQDKNFYFMEMNTRLQVEHPVTEMVTGLDLVRLQIEVASGGFLPPHINRYGHAVEARVYAEDPFNGFLPVSGDVLLWREPPNHHLNDSKRLWAWSKVIVDSGIRSGDPVTVYYDPTLAKIIAHGDTREDAIRRLDHALARTQLFGIRSNITYLGRILNHPDYVTGNISTEFIDQHPELLADEPPPPLVAWIAAALAKTGDTSAHWRNNPYRPIKHTFKHETQAKMVLLAPRPIDKSKWSDFDVHIDGVQHHVEAWSLHEHQLDLAVDGHRQRVTVIDDDHDGWWVHCSAGTFQLTWLSPLPAGKTAEESEGSLRAPMPGQVIRVNVEAGQPVAKGDVLLIIEAMKMEHRIKAPFAGTVAEIHFQIGQSVQQGVKLLELHASVVE
ncbi:MAG: biotin/lipoyl-binding protein [Anaerolinea sp.]|nr:biotin/lipoyl-binding protein [Anaerolinea sp.]